MMQEGLCCSCHVILATLLLLLQLQSAIAELEPISADPVEVRQLNHLVRPTPVTKFPSIELWAGGAGAGAGSVELRMPYDAFLVPDASGGQLFVSDTHNHRVQRWDVPDAGKLPSTVAGGHGQGRGLHQLRFPKGVVVDASGNLYIADSGNNRVVKWSPGASEGVIVAGEYRAVLNKQGVQQGSYPFCCTAGKEMKQLQDPHGVFVDDQGTVLVADTGNDRVQRWQGQVATTVAGGQFAKASVKATSLSRPRDVFMKSGVVYVSDSGNDRVMAWPTNATEGFVVAGGNGRGHGLDQLVSPAGIWVDDSLQENGVPVKELYVVDTYNHRIMKHRVPGDYLNATPAVVAGSCLQNPPYIDPCIAGGLHYPPNPVPDREGLINPSNTNPPVYHFWGPMGIWVSEGARNITVVDTLNHRVQAWIGYR